MWNTSTSLKEMFSVELTPVYSLSLRTYVAYVPNLSGYHSRLSLLDYQNYILDCVHDDESELAT